jgi:hypothetical protein
VLQAVLPIPHHNVPELWESGIDREIQAYLSLQGRSFVCGQFRAVEGFLPGLMSESALRLALTGVIILGEVPGNVGRNSTLLPAYDRAIYI